MTAASAGPSNARWIHRPVLAVTFGETSLTYAVCVWQVWMQEFCWSYRSKAAKLAARNQSAPQNAELLAAPMFCFEVCCLALYLPQALPHAASMHDIVFA